MDNSELNKGYVISMCWSVILAAILNNHYTADKVAETTKSISFVAPLR